MEYDFLNDQENEVWKLRTEEKLSYAKIGKRIGLSIQRVINIFHKAQMKIRAVMEGTHPLLVKSDTIACFALKLLLESGVSLEKITETPIEDIPALCREVRVGQIAHTRAGYIKNMATQILKEKK